MKGSNLKSTAKSIDQLWMSEYINTYTDETSKLAYISMQTYDNTAKSAAPKVPVSNKLSLSAIELKLKPYRTRNIEPEGGIKKKVTNKIKSKRLEKLFEVQRREHEAAKVIQGFWRRSQVLLPWRRAVKQVLMATIIQKRIRGYITRKFIGIWYYKRTDIAIQWQARVRRVISNKLTRLCFGRERRAATRIQAAFRSFWCRRQLLRTRQIAACLVIQRTWRGVVSRCIFDRLWLDKVVVPIQAAGRRMLAAHKVKALRRELNAASMIIQRKYRQWRAFCVVGEAFYEREYGYRQGSIDRMTAAIGWAEDELVKLAKRLNKTQLVKKTETVVNAVYEKYDFIHELQCDLIEMQRQSETLSPRSIQLGWALTIKEDLIKLRDKLTEEKLNCIFGHAYEVTKLDAMLESRVKDIEAMVRIRNRYSAWREDEQNGLHSMQFERRGAAKEKKRIQAIADERRKWQLIMYTRNGKPDKRRRPGRPWDKEAYAGQEKATYTAGHDVDLLARQREKDPLGAPGSKESVDQTVSEYSLQVYLDQVNQYEKLLNPLTEIMSDYMGGEYKGRSTGYGAEGERVASELEGMGAIERKPREVTVLALLNTERAATAEHTLPAPVKSKSFSSKRGSSPPKFRKTTSALSMLSDLSMSVVDDYDSLSQSNASVSEPGSPPTVYSRAVSSSPVSVYTRTASGFSQDYKDSVAASSKKSVKLASSMHKSKSSSTASSAIPWEMLDKLEADKKKFEENMHRTKSSFSFKKV